MHNHRSQASVSAFQGDTAVRLFINITDGGVPYVISDGCVAVLTGTKADGNKLEHRCAILNSSTIQYDFNEQTSSCRGIVNCEIALYGADGNVITAPKFIIVVDEREVNGSEFPLSQDDETLLASIATDEAQRIVAENARVSAESARVDAELSRVNAESARVVAETARADAESAREMAEEMRADSESSREAAVAQAISYIDSYTDWARDRVETAIAEMVSKTYFDKTMGDVCAVLDALHEGGDEV
jgi:hypothetical protein